MIIPSVAVTSILCAGPGLGFYVPGIIMNRQLLKAGMLSYTYVFEDFLVPDKKRNIAAAKAKFHQNFSFALMGQQLAKDPSPYLDPAAISGLLALWKEENRKHFVVFSGFWIPVLKQFLREYKVSDLVIELCHVDADQSTSWKLFETTEPFFNHVWLFDWSKKKINCYFNVAQNTPPAYSERNKNIVIHGGGWGMGTYQNKIPLMQQTDFHLNIIAYNLSETDEQDEQKTFYLLNPAWNTWDLNAAGSHTFPKLNRVKGNGEIADDRQTEDDNYPLLYNLTQNSKAIISKPGGGTLIDSLSSATPIIILEPFGEYENKNGLLWKHFGFGISFDEWAASGYSEGLIENLHYNLLSARKSTKDYIQYYINTNSHGI